MADTSGDAHAARAEVALKLRRWADAEAEARRALAADPASVAGHASLARALSGQGRHEEAVSAAESGLAVAPDSEWLHRVRGWACIGAGRIKDALASGETALRISPENAAAHQLVGQALLALGRRLHARRSAERALSLAPPAPELHALLGDAWLKDDSKIAERHYRSSLALDPNQPLVLNNLAVALMRQGRREEASEALQAALKLDPTHRLPKVNAFVLSSAILRRSPWTWLVLSLSALVIGVSLVAARLEGTASWAALGLAGLLVVVQLAVGRHAQRAGMARLQGVDRDLHRTRAHLDRELKAGRELLAPALTLRLGRLLVAFSMLTIGLSVVASVVWGREYLAYPASPRRTTLESAAADEWVTLEGITRDCGTAATVHGRGYVLGRSTGGLAVVSELDGSRSCEREPATLTGVASPELNPRLRATLTKAGLELPGDHVAELCTSCGPGATLALLALAVPFGAVGGFLLREGRRMVRRARTARAAHL